MGLPSPTSSDGLKTALGFAFVPRKTRRAPNGGARRYIDAARRRAPANNRRTDEPMERPTCLVSLSRPNFHRISDRSSDQPAWYQSADRLCDRITGPPTRRVPINPPNFRPKHRPTDRSNLPYINLTTELPTEISTRRPSFLVSINRFFGRVDQPVWYKSID